LFWALENHPTNLQRQLERMQEDGFFNPHKQVGKNNRKSTFYLEVEDQVMEADNDTCDPENKDQFLEAEKEGDDHLRRVNNETQQSGIQCTAPSNIENQSANQLDPQSDYGHIQELHQQEDEVVMIAMDQEYSLLDELSTYQYIIVNTRSPVNLIGRDLLPMLIQRLTEVGVELKPLSAQKSFQLGRIKVKSTERLVVPIHLGKTTMHAEVFIVDNRIPFMLGGELFIQYKAEISIGENILTINNHQIPLRTLQTGHNAIVWNYRIHRERGINKHPVKEVVINSTDQPGGHEDEIETHKKPESNLNPQQEIHQRNI